MPTDGPVNPDSLRELTAAMHAFVESKGWNASTSPHPQTPRNLAISLVLEAGEVLEHFQWSEASPNDELAHELAGELADVLLYLLQIASIQDINLGAAVLEKLRLNYTRTWDTNSSE